MNVADREVEAIYPAVTSWHTDNKNKSLFGAVELVACCEQVSTRKDVGCYASIRWEAMSSNEGGIQQKQERPTDKGQAASTKDRTHAVGSVLALKMILYAKPGLAPIRKSFVWTTLVDKKCFPKRSAFQSAPWF